MLPVTHGVALTQRCIVLYYTILLVLISVMPYLYWYEWHAVPILVQSAARRRAFCYYAFADANTRRTPKICR